MKSNAFSFSKTLAKPFDATVSQVRDLMKEQGFGVITEVDFQKAFKEKINKDTRKCMQLGACNPKMAYDVVEAAWENTVLLPCHVCIIERGENETQVCCVDPRKMFGAFLHENEALKCIAEDADGRLRRVMDKLQ